MKSINSIILANFAKFRKNNINEIFKELQNNLEKGSIYIFVEDLKTNTLVKSYKYKITEFDIENLNKYEKDILNKISYFEERKYEDKYLLHFFYFQDKQDKNDKNDKNKIKNINKIYKKVFKYDELSNNLTFIEELLIQFTNFTLKHPVEIISVIIATITSYLLINLFSEGLKLEEINMTIFSLTIEFFIILTGILMGLYFLIIFFSWSFFGINLKSILGFIIILVLMFVLLVFFKNNTVLNRYIIEKYLKFQTFPRFAMLVILKGNQTINKPVLIRFVDNKYIYYNNICDINYSNSKELNVLDIIENKANNSLLSISTSKVEQIIDTHFKIQTNYLYKICNKEK